MTLKNIFKTNWKRLTLTYTLFNIENIMSLAKPYFLGKAIDTTIKGDLSGFYIFMGLYCLFAVTGAFRRVYDTRTFASVYAKLATDIVKQQHKKEISASKIAARASLSNKFVDFFETDITVFFQTLYNIFGSLIMLFLYTKKLLFYCLVIVIPIALINRYYSKTNLKLTQKYNDQIEKTVDNISSKDDAKIEQHYNIMSKLRIKISDNEALTFLMAEVFIIFLISSSLLAFYGKSNVTIGSVVAVFQYVNMFILGLDDVPYLIAQLNKIKDIQKRILER